MVLIYICIYIYDKWLATERQPGTANQPLLWSFQLGNPIGNFNQATTPRPTRRNPEAKLGDPKPRLRDPEPRLGVPKPRLGVPIPRLGEPKPRLGVSKPRLGDPTPSGDPKARLGPQACDWVPQA